MDSGLPITVNETHIHIHTVDVLVAVLVAHQQVEGALVCVENWFWWRELTKEQVYFLHKS